MGEAPRRKTTSHRPQPASKKGLNLPAASRKPEAVNLKRFGLFVFNLIQIEGSAFRVVIDIGCPAESTDDIRHIFAF